MWLVRVERKELVLSPGYGFHGYRTEHAHETMRTEHHMYGTYKGAMGYIERIKSTKEIAEGKIRLVLFEETTQTFKQESLF